MSKFIELTNKEKIYHVAVDHIVMFWDKGFLTTLDFDPESVWPCDQSAAEIERKIREAEGESIPAQLAECKGVDVVGELIEALKTNRGGIRDVLSDHLGIPFHPLPQRAVTPVEFMGFDND